jgi:hypothetical protein
MTSVYSNILYMPPKTPWSGTWYHTRKYVEVTDIVIPV